MPRPKATARGLLPLTEHGETVALCQRAHYNARSYPELSLLIGIKNEATYRRADLRAEGIKAGVPDLFLPVARGGHHGLFIEMKVARGKPSVEQLRFAGLVTAQGYQVRFCWGQEQGWQALLSYLAGEPDEKP